MLINDLFADGKVASREIAIKANVPDKYILDSGTHDYAPALTPSCRVLTGGNKQIAFVLVTISVLQLMNPDGMIARGSLDVQYRINLANSKLKQLLQTSLRMNSKKCL